MRRNLPRIAKDISLLNKLTNLENVQRKKKRRNNQKKNDWNIFAETEKINTVKMTENSIRTETFLNLLQNFDGKKVTNIEQHLDQFERIVTQSKIPDEFKVLFLKSKFVGQARDIIQENEELNQENDYNSLKEKLIKQFKKDLIFEEHQASFMQIRQNPTESIETYVNKFNSTAIKYLKASGHAEKKGAQEFLETLKLTRFVETIRPDIAYEVKKSAPKKFEDAVAFAKQIELAKNSFPAESVNAVNNSAPNDELCQMMVNLNIKQTETIEKLREEINTIKNNKIEPKQEKKFCHICEVGSHDTKSCYFNSSQNPGKDKYCHICCMKSHDTRECRFNQKSNSHPKFQQTYNYRTNERRQNSNYEEPNRNRDKSKYQQNSSQFQNYRNSEKKNSYRDRNNGKGNYRNQGNE